MKHVVQCVALMFVIGVFCLFIGLQAAIWMGAKWYGNDHADSDWWMNTYFSVPAKTAYVFFSITSLVLGGVFAGVSLPLIFYKPKLAVPPFFASIIFSGLGFNTFDWMISYVAGGGGESNTFTYYYFHLGLVIDGWNFYFFFVILPLWLGGFLIATPLVYYLCKIYNFKKCG